MRCPFFLEVSLKCPFMEEQEAGTCRRVPCQKLCSIPGSMQCLVTNGKAAPVLGSEVLPLILSLESSEALDLHLAPAT